MTNRIKIKTNNKLINRRKQSIKSVKNNKHLQSDLITKSREESVEHFSSYPDYYGFSQSQQLDYNYPKVSQSKPKHKPDSIAKQIRKDVDSYKEDMVWLRGFKYVQMSKIINVSKLSTSLKPITYYAFISMPYELNYETGEVSKAKKIRVLVSYNLSFFSEQFKQYKKKNIKVYPSLKSNLKGLSELMKNKSMIETGTYTRLVSFTLPKHGLKESPRNLFNLINTQYKNINKTSKNINSSQVHFYYQ